MPSALEPYYGTRSPRGFAIYVRFRPQRMSEGHDKRTTAPGAAPHDATHRAQHGSTGAGGRRRRRNSTIMEVCVKLFIEGRSVLLRLSASCWPPPSWPGPRTRAPPRRPPASTPCTTPERWRDGAALPRGVEAGRRTGALALLAPDAVVLESGDTESLAEYRSRHLPADIAFAQAVRETRSAIRVTVRGDAAWAVSTTSVLGTYRTRPIDSAGAELMVLSRTPKGWVISAIHWSSRSKKK